MGGEDISLAVEQLGELDRAAVQAANAGLWAEAERCWSEMRRLAPNNRAALWGLGYAALQRGDASSARELLLAAQKAAPTDKLVLMTLAKACRGCKDLTGEIATLKAVLALDAKYLPGLLAMGAAMERTGRPEAVTTYISALDAAPARPEDWPLDCRDHLERAKGVVERHRQETFGAIWNRIAAVGGDMPDAERGRWREAASIMAKATKPYHSQSHRLFVPRLAAQPFHDRAQFPWVQALEARTDVIRDELLRALNVKHQDFVPYVSLDKASATDEWKDINQSTRWSVFYLWQNGAPNEENQALCPETATALSLVDQPTIRGNCPNAMFSALAPRTRIPPHAGESNARLVVHLPLIVPEKCVFRVGFEEREWKVGEAVIFDDSIEHEARNDSDELRVVLLFDVWNPQLTAKERDMVNALVAAEADLGVAR